MVKKLNLYRKSIRNYTIESFKLELTPDKTKKATSHSIGLLSKVRYYVPKHLLRTIYHSVFNSHLIYACEIWGQNKTNHYFKKLLRLQEEALRIIDFKPQASPSGCIF